MVHRRMVGAGTRDRGGRFEIRRHTNVRGSEALAAEGEPDQDPVARRAARLGAERLREMIDPEVRDQRGIVVDRRARVVRVSSDSEGACCRGGDRLFG